MNWDKLSAEHKRVMGKIDHAKVWMTDRQATHALLKNKSPEIAKEAESQAATPSFTQPTAGLGRKRESTAATPAKR